MTCPVLTTNNDRAKRFNPVWFQSATPHTAFPSVFFTPTFMPCSKWFPLYQK